MLSIVPGAVLLFDSPSTLNNCNKSAVPEVTFTVMSSPAEAAKFKVVASVTVVALTEASAPVGAAEVAKVAPLIVPLELPI